MKQDRFREFQVQPRPFDDFAWAFGSLRTLKRTFNFVLHELRSPVTLPLRDSLRAWLSGFSRISYRANAASEDHREHHVTSFTQIARSHRVNGVYDLIINNKAIHHLLMKSADLPCPAHLGLLHAEKLQLTDGTYVPMYGDTIKTLAESPPGIVIRPVKGMKGIGLLFVSRSRTGLMANQAPISSEDLERLVPTLAPAVVTEKVEQSDYSRNLYSRTVNTVRFLTLWDYDRGEPFLAAAAQRIGTSRSFPADNFRGGLGGISSDIDLESGVTGPARGLDLTYSVFQTDTHPESGERIEGLTVPSWEAMVAASLRGARTFHFAPMLAWDVAITRQGFSVLEVNGTPGLPVHQIHRPLLADPRIRNFYRYHRLIR